uniref:Uncharacterized protein n=1 Tax=Rhizophora mucronata TaxID=61149 RepID=A0A2P2P1P2_RHIMU
MHHEKEWKQNDQLQILNSIKHLASDQIKYSHVTV